MSQWVAMATEPPRFDAQQTQRALSRLVEGIVKLFGSKQPKSEATPSAGRQEAAAVAQPQAAAPQPNKRDTLEQTLARFDSMPQEMSELRRSLTDVLHNFGMAIDHLGIEAKRLSNESSALALMTDKLQMRLEDLQRTLNGDFAERQRGPVVQEEAPAPTEPQFRPSDQGVSVVLTQVRGFQGLMDAQRALNDMPEVEKATIANFRNEEAIVQLVLHTPVTARQIVDVLAQATGEELLIEESRPEAQRLRLRFVERESRR